MDSEADAPINMRRTESPPRDTASVLPWIIIDQIYHSLPQPWEQGEQYPATRWNFSTVCKDFRAVVLTDLLR